MSYFRVKRILDILLSLLGLILLSPFFIMIIMAIKFMNSYSLLFNSKGPVLFKQKRIGIHKTNFDILKFRTMRIDTPKDIPTHLLENPDQWITKVGKFLRRTSLDELPQIINILKGEMSIIGPRPALWNQFDLIKERDKHGANDIKPGLTGWAQINGKAKFDGEYVEKLGFVMDIKCFVMTVISVFKSDGVLEGGTGSLEQHKVHDVKETIS